MTPLVLIVDDEPEIVEVIRDTITGEYRTHSASNGAEAIAEFQRERPDVVLLDVNMPGMNGIDAQRELQRIDPTVPVIMLTAIQDVSLLASALTNGAFGYMPKPFHAVYLTHLLAAAVSHRGERRA